MLTVIDPLQHQHISPKTIQKAQKRGKVGDGLVFSEKEEEEEEEGDGEGCRLEVIPSR